MNVLGWIHHTEALKITVLDNCFTNSKPFLNTIRTMKKDFLCVCAPWVKPSRIQRYEIPQLPLHEFSKWVFMFYITIWYSAASYKDISPCHTHTHTDTYMLPKAKQMSHQAHISPKFSNSQNRKHEAKLSLHRCVHTPLSLWFSLLDIWFPLSSCLPSPSYFELEQI